MQDLLTIKTNVMNRKRIIIIAIIVAITGGAWYGYKEYNRKVKDLTKVKAQVQMNAASLIGAFEKNEAAANTAYLDKIIAVQGTVKSVEKNDQGFYTVVLGDEGSMSSVRCSMDAVHQQDAAGLTEGAAVTMKGACTGFNADELLGSDVVLNRCVIQD